MSGAHRVYNVQSVKRAIDIIQLLSQRDSMSLVELSENIGAPKSSIFTILQTLCNERILERLPDGEYCLGFALYKILLSSKSADLLRELSSPLIQELAQHIGMTVHVSVQEGLESFYVAKAEGQRFVQFNTFIGQGHPLYLTSAGKALLIDSSDDSIREMFSGYTFEKKTQNTITSLEKFIQNIHKARESGFAIEDEEGEIGIRCLGVPVRDIRNHVIAAISITALKEQLHEENYKKIGDQVINTSLKLGYSLQNWHYLYKVGE